MEELRIKKLSEIDSEPVEWLWEPYIPYGAVSLLQGDGGSGKTTAALAVAAAVTRGGALPAEQSVSRSNCPWAGTGAAPAAVIIQNAEDSYAQTIRPKLERFGADCRMVHVIDEDERGLSLSDERIEKAVIETGARLLILDPVQAYLGGANMNSANGVRPLLKRLGDMAAIHGCAVLLVGHLHKQGGKAQYRGLGSIDIFAAARSVLTVGSIPMDDDMRVIVHNKSNLAAPGVSQAFGLDTAGNFVWLGEYSITIDEVLNNKKKPESQFAKARKLIETTLANGPAAAAEIMQAAEEQGISPKTLNRAKDALGVISVKRGVQWFWEIPIDVSFTEGGQGSQDGQENRTGSNNRGGQHGQANQDGRKNNGHGNDCRGKTMTDLTGMTSLTVLRGEAV